MKRAGLFMAALMLAGMMTACDRRQSPESPGAYDPAVDGPPSVIAVRIDPSIVADQTAISRAQERRAPAAPSAEAPAPAAQGEAAAANPAEAPAVAGGPPPTENPTETPAAGGPPPTDNPMEAPAAAAPPPPDNSPKAQAQRVVQSAGPKKEVDPNTGD